MLNWASGLGSILLYSRRTSGAPAGMSGALVEVSSNYPRPLVSRLLFQLSWGTTQAKWLWKSSETIFMVLSSGLQIPSAAAIFSAKPPTPIVWLLLPWNSSLSHLPGHPGL